MANEDARLWRTIFVQVMKQRNPVDLQAVYTICRYRFRIKDSGSNALFFSVEKKSLISCETRKVKGTAL